MAGTGCCGKVFVFFNCIMWLIGLCVGGYGVWILYTTGNTSNFLSGTLIFTYSFLGIGVLLVFTGLLGCVGGCCESTCFLKIYIGFMALIIVIDIAAGAAGYAQRNEVLYLTDKLWDELNEDTKFHIQKELECCSYDNITIEYGTDNSTYPESCSNSQGQAFNTFCKDAMELWVKRNFPVWASIAGAIVVIQLFAAITSWFSLKSVQKSMRVGSHDD